MRALYECVPMAPFYERPPDGYGRLPSTRARGLPRRVEADVALERRKQAFGDQREAIQNDIFCARPGRLGLESENHAATNVGHHGNYEATRGFGRHPGIGDSDSDAAICPLEQFAQVVGDQVLAVDIGQVSLPFARPLVAGLASDELTIGPRSKDDPRGARLVGCAQPGGAMIIDLPRGAVGEAERELEALGVEGAPAGPLP